MAEHQTISVLLADGLLTLNRIIGALRRRRMPLARFALSPAGTGEARLTFVIAADSAAAERVARQLAKVIGVRSVVVLSGGGGGDDPGIQELALIRVREPGAMRAELWRLVSRFPATVVSESPDGVVIRVAGSERIVQSLLEALEPFAILDVARSGPIVLGAASITPEEVVS
jgi:acetolactate synthase I/III small subunit